MAFVVRLREEADAARAFVVPSRIVEDWIQADPSYIDPGPASRHNLLTHIVEPGSTRGALSAGLGDEDRPHIARRRFGEHASQGPVSMVAKWDRAASVIPLVFRVEIQAHDVEEVGCPSQFGLEATSKHVRRLELNLSVPLRSLPVRLIPQSAVHMDNRLRSNDRGPGIRRADCIRRCDGSAHELAFQLVPAPVRTGIEAAHLTPSPGPERDLVDRAIEAPRSRLVADDSRGSARKPRKALGE